jgi:hypothetical protein
MTIYDKDDLKKNVSEGCAKEKERPNDDFPGVKALMQ